MNEKGKFFYEYVKDDITILCGKNETEIKARYINKYTDNANIPTIYTSAWGEKAIGSTESLNVTEFVVALKPPWGRVVKGRAAEDMSHLLLYQFQCVLDCLLAIAEVGS